MKQLFCISTTLALLAASAGAMAKTAPEPAYLSPTALAASSDGRLFVACATSGRVLVFDTATQTVRSAIDVPASPLGLALSPDESQLFVTCAAPESTVAIVDVAKQKVSAKIKAGHTTMAPVASPDGKTLYVCNRFNNSVSFIDISRRKIVAEIKVPREPVAAGVSRDGKYLFVANHIHAGRSDVDVVAATISVIDTTAKAVVKEIALPNGSTVVRGVAISPDGKYAAITHILARFHLPTTQIERGWINNNALSLIDIEKLERLNTVLLDNVDAGAGNPWGVEWSGDAKSLCVTHAGTHEVSIIDWPALLDKLAKVPEVAEPSKGYSNSASRTKAHVPNDLAFLVGIRQRIKLGTAKAPRAIAIMANRIYTANYFSDSLSTFEIGSKAPPAALALAAPQPLSVLRQGELNFNDASVCFQGWQSCASCHSSDARVDGMNWDNLNDGIGNPKNVRSMLLAHKTPPSMALAVRDSAEVAVRAGIKHSLFVVLPEEFAVAVDEYLKSLEPIPSPHLDNGKLSRSAKRGQKLFMSEEVGCTDCHKPGLFTAMKQFDVGTRGRYDKETDKFDTPTLIEVWRTAPYLHDGSAVTIRDVIAGNKTGKHGTTSHLTDQQLDDLVAYVLSL